MDLTTTIFFSFIVGFIPALIWLFYFLREDKKNPEPSGVIITTFVYGMITVPIALVFQQIVNALVLQGRSIENLFFIDYVPALVTLILWASFEEVVKYVAAYKGGISKKANNEPIDPVIYMITAALGFAALENTLFVFTPFLDGSSLTAVLTGNLRFVGATLLHVAASAIVGMFISFSYYKKEEAKKTLLFYGIVLSIVLHVMFNSFIIRGGNFTIVGFSTVWISIIIIIILFEKVKKIYKPFKKIE
jgi:RsiW-degrading membrane proteinase PrsW (M82 family)